MYFFCPESISCLTSSELYKNLYPIFILHSVQILPNTLSSQHHNQRQKTNPTFRYQQISDSALHHTFLLLPHREHLFTWAKFKTLIT